MPINLSRLLYCTWECRMSHLENRKMVNSLGNMVEFRVESDCKKGCDARLCSGWQDKVSEWLRFSTITCTIHDSMQIGTCCILIWTMLVGVLVGRARRKGVQAVSNRLAMVVSWAAWGRIGIPNASGASSAANPSLTGSFPSKEGTPTIVIATRRLSTPSAKSVANL